MDLSSINHEFAYVWIRDHLGEPPPNAKNRITWYVRASVLFEEYVAAAYRAGRATVNFQTFGEILKIAFPESEKKLLHGVPVFDGLRFFPHGTKTGEIKFG